MNKNYDCIKTSPYPKGKSGLLSAWDNPKYRHPDSVLIDQSDEYTDVYSCPNCKQKFSVHSQYYMDCVGYEMEAE